MAAKNLTDTACKKAGEGEYADGASPGLRLIVSKTGVKSWQYRYRSPLDNKLKRMHFGRYPAMSLGDARIRWQELSQLRANGGDPLEHRETERAQKVAEAAKRFAERKDQAFTVEIAIDQYIEHISDRLKSWRNVEGVLRKDLLPRHQDKPFREFSRSDATKIHDNVSRRAPVVANRLKKYASAMWEWHMDRDESVEVNPWRRVKANPEKARERTLNTEELKVVLAGKTEIAVQYQTVLLGCLYSGCRIGEVTNWRRSWIADDRIVIPSALTKNGREHHVHLSRQLKTLLDEQGDEGDLFFPSEKRAGSPIDPRVVARHLRGCGYESVVNFASHDLRRTMATWLGEQEACEPHVIDRMLNHADVSVTGAHYNHAKLRKPAARWWQAWADYLTGLEAVNVTQLRRNRI